MKRKFSRSK